MFDSKIPCIRCDKPLDNSTYMHGGIAVEVHPSSGLHFRTYGHYGSTIFDPMGTNETLDVAICDECIMLRLDNVRGTGKPALVANFDSYLKSTK
jgi:hypothetical protein